MSGVIVTYEDGEVSEYRGRGSAAIVATPAVAGDHRRNPDMAEYITLSLAIDEVTVKAVKG